MPGVVYTYTANTQSQSGDAAIETSQGWVPLGQSGLFLPAELQAAQQDGCVLTLGPANSPAFLLTAPTVVAGSAGTPNGAYRYCVTFVTGVGETKAGPEFGPITLTSVQGSVSVLPLGDATSGVTARKIYRTAAGGASGTEKLVTTIADNTTLVYTDNTVDGSLGAVLPTVDTSFVAVNLAGFSFTQVPRGTTFGQEGL